MPMPTDAGTYLAEATTAELTVSGPSDLATILVQYLLIGIRDRDQDGWIDITADGLEIRGYHYLEKKDGSINAFTLDALKEAFEWDGIDVMDLVNGDLPDCHLVIESENYQGVNRLKIKYLNHKDGKQSEIQPADPVKVKAALARISPKLRARSSGKPVEKTIPPKQNKMSERQVAQEEAWGVYYQAGVAKDMSEEQIVRSWQVLIERQCGDLELDDLPLEKWAKMGGFDPKAVWDSMSESLKKGEEELPF